MNLNFIRLIDFGYSVDLDQPLSEPLQKLLKPFVIGTPYYVSPEQLEAQQLETKIESDMWSVGVMVYQLILGKYPFDSAIGRDDLNKKILCCKYSFPEDHKLDRDCKNFIEDLLDPRPSSRLTPEQALNHPWLKQETPIWTIKKEVIQRLQSYRKSNDFLFICQRIIVSCFL